MKAAAVAAIPLNSGHRGVSDWNQIRGLCTILEVLLFFICDGETWSWVPYRYATATDSHYSYAGKCLKQHQLHVPVL
jgi:hypothetical protein